MATLRGYIDGTGIIAATSKDERDDKDGIVHHLKKAAVAKVRYDVAKANLASKMAPMQHMTQLVQQMHGPNPQDSNDPFQNPYQQQGEGGPGGVGQGMENQDDLARTGQMQKPSPGGVDNSMKKGPMGNQPGKPQDDGNKRLQTPDSRMAQGKPQQRSTSGNKPPGKQTQPTEGKPVKKAKKIKLEISDDKMAAEAIKNGMKRCKTCKNFFNPVHPKAGKSHCPDCKQGSMTAANVTTKRGKKVKTTGDYHDNPGVSMPTVGIGLSATKRLKAFGKNEHQEKGKRSFPPRGF